MQKRYRKALTKNIVALSTIVFIVFTFSAAVTTQINSPENTTSVNVMDINKGITNPVQKDTICLMYGNKPLDLSYPVFVHTARYYLPLKDIITCMGGSITANGNKAYAAGFNGSSFKIDTAKSTYEKDSKKYRLSKKFINIKEESYISLFDFTKMLGLVTYWNIENKTVSFYPDIDPVKPGEKPAKGKPALVRLEDMTAFGGIYAKAPELAYYRVMADYFYSKAIPFSVAWVPRFIKPAEKIDNDPVRDYNLYNMDFIYTLDYLIDKGGIIGLHGYTHQSGKTASIAGVEFGKGVNESDSATHERIDSAISSAKALYIPIGFFEFPHYSATARQYKIAEEYFDYIYENPYNSWGSEVVRRQNNGRSVKYLPTPLNYLESKAKIDTMISRINSLGDSSLASFFFHTYLDYEFIKVTRDASGCPIYSYSEDSRLHRIINAIEKRGYRFVKPSDL